MGNKRYTAALSIISTAAVGMLNGGTPGLAWDDIIIREQGPGPILNGEPLLPDKGPTAGAINAIVPSPASADVVFVGTVSGGVWETSNATSATPNWIPLTDHDLPELFINSLAMSPVNSSILYAGTGSTSSYNRLGSLGIGVARSTDGGQSWKVLAGSTFTGRAINSIVPTTLNGGRTVFAATWLDGGGVFQSTDSGKKFTRISGNGSSGLPNAGVTNLIADPSNRKRFYAGVPASAGGGAQAGVYRNDDGGVTWSNVSTGLKGLSNSARILLALHSYGQHNIVYAEVITSDGTLSGVFRSTNQGVSWTSLGVPSPPIFPAGEGKDKGAIVAHPADPAVVFISGDAQDDGPFPNQNGCNDDGGNIFRYTGSAWEIVVCNGAQGKTAPHVDLRFMAFDAKGNLLEASDGGIARLENPNAAARRWVSAVGNIRTAELHTIAYDPLSKIVLGGAQDNGVPIQTKPGVFVWDRFLGGDGGYVAVDADQVKHPKTSLRYSSSQFFDGFNRSTWDASNKVLDKADVGLKITTGPGKGYKLKQFDPNLGRFQPFALNAIDPSRMLIVTGNVYESFTGGDTLANIAHLRAKFSPEGYGHPIAYGGRLNGIPKPDVFYAGTDNEIFHRVDAGGRITKLNSYPGEKVITIATNPNNYKDVYVSDINNKIWRTSDEGMTWVDLTSNLPHLTALVTTIEIVAPDRKSCEPTLFAGGFGVFRLTQNSKTNGRWIPIDHNVKPAAVLDLHHDHTDKVLVAGTQGRGAWLYSGNIGAGC